MGLIWSGSRSERGETGMPFKRWFIQADIIPHLPPTSLWNEHIGQLQYVWHEWNVITASIRAILYIRTISSTRFYLFIFILFWHFSGFWMQGQQFKQRCPDLPHRLLQFFWELWGDSKTRRVLVKSQAISIISLERHGSFPLEASLSDAELVVPFNVEERLWFYFSEFF